MTKLLPLKVEFFQLNYSNSSERDRYSTERSCGDPGNIFDVTIIISNALSVIDSKLLLTGTLPTATVIIESHKAKVSSKIPIVASHNTASV